MQTTLESGDPSATLNTSAKLQPVPLWFVLLLNAAALCLVIYMVRLVMNRQLRFDDAFMFERYAIHLRQGLGISWNPDGVHTGGMTSLGWFVAMIPIVFVPLMDGQPLALEGFLVGIAGMTLIAWSTSRLSSVPLLRRFWVVLPTVILVLVGTYFFQQNMVHGMDTMLSFSANAAVACAIWAWCRAEKPSPRLAAMLGLLGFCAVVVRPENGLFAVVATTLAGLLLLDRSRRSELTPWGITFASLLLLFACWYRVYFHAWLPLGFYMKNGHAYRGYLGAVRFPPDVYTRNFLLLAAPVLAFPLLSSERRGQRVALAFLLPVALTFVYLSTVTQIMGAFSRYYVPFMAPVAVAALWMTDLALVEGWQQRLRQRWLGFGILAIVLLGVGAVSWRPIHRWTQRRLSEEPYPAPELIYPAAGTKLRRPLWFTTASLLGSEVIQRLPAGAVIATTEVGIIGQMAPHVSVIDLAGLNDNDIALHGFDVDRFLDRKPVLIWFPHGDYTWQRQAMFCSRKLLDSYTVVGGDAFIFSIAIRKDDPETADVTKNVNKVFEQVYPGARMADYIVSSVNCPAK